jgi:hypothetical protein
MENKDATIKVMSQFALPVLGSSDSLIYTEWSDGRRTESVVKREYKDGACHESLGLDRDITAVDFTAAKQKWDKQNKN